MSLLTYLHYAAQRLRDSRSLPLFVEIRYYEMAQLFPHGVFSVGQASLDFFDLAIGHLNGEPFDKDWPGKSEGKPAPKPSEYEANYRRWIGTHVSS